MHTDIQAAIAVAASRELDEIVKRVTALWGRGTITDDEFSALYGAAHRRRADLRGQGPERDEPIYRAPRRGVVFSPRPSQRSPDRQRSMERRRTLAASGPLPPRLAARFTTGEQAVLRIVVDEVRARGLCDRSLDEIAARAGVSRSLTKQALRIAARHGLLRIQERPRPGDRHLTNVVTITSAEWTAWLTRGRQGGGGRNPATTDTQDKRGFEQKPWRGREPLMCRDSRMALGSPPARDRHGGGGR